MDYEGWSTQETWAVHMMMTNEKAHANDLKENILFARRTQATLESQIHMLSCLLEEFVECINPMDVYQNTSKSMFCSLMNCAIGNVNWKELAKFYLENLHYDSLTTD